MNKTFLGVNAEHTKCCIVTDTKRGRRYSATNWMGQDTIQRTLVLGHFHLTGQKIFQNGTYKGIDYNMGHKYSFEFHFTELWEVAKNT